MIHVTCLNFNSLMSGVHIMSCWCRDVTSYFSSFSRSRFRVCLISQIFLVCTRGKFTSCSPEITQKAKGKQRKWETKHQSHWGLRWRNKANSCGAFLQTQSSVGACFFQTEKHLQIDVLIVFVLAAATNVSTLVVSIPCDVQLFPMQRFCDTFTLFVWGVVQKGCAECHFGLSF